MFVIAPIILIFIFLLDELVFILSLLDVFFLLVGFVASISEISISVYTHIWFLACVTLIWFLSYVDFLKLYWYFSLSFLG
jgi:hypothetical protein